MIDFTNMKCQEASPFTGNLYTPCGQQANSVVWHSRDNRAYLMCVGCADHNVRNRGGKLIAEDAPTRWLMQGIEQWETSRRYTSVQVAAFTSKPIRRLP